MPELEFKDLVIVILIGFNVLQFLLTREMIRPKDAGLFIELLRDSAKRTPSTLDDRLLDMADSFVGLNERDKDKTQTVTLHQVVSDED